MKYAILIVAIITTMAFLSCDDDESSKDKAVILSDKNWKLTAVTIDPAISIHGSAPITNLFPQYKECYKDDITKFSTNYTVIFDEGVSKCNTSDPQTTTGTWSFNLDKTIISITVQNETTSFTLHELSDKILKSSYKEVNDEDGLTYTITETYNN